MGDMADMCMWDERDLWDDGDEPLPPPLITCRYCGEKGLEWRKIEGKWRLHKPAGKLHACKVNPLPAPPIPRAIINPVEKAFRAGYKKGHATFSYAEGGPPFERGQDDAWKEYNK